MQKMRHRKQNWTKGKSMYRREIETGGSRQIKGGKKNGKWRYGKDKKRKGKHNKTGSKRQENVKRLHTRDGERKTQTSSVERCSAGLR